MIYKQSLHWNFLPKECASKFPFFIKYCAMTLIKLSKRCVFNYDATNLPYCSFGALYTKVFRGYPEVDLVSKVLCPKSCNPDLCNEKGQFWIVFSWKQFSWPNNQFLPNDISWKLWFERFIWGILDPSKCILCSVRFFIRLCDRFDTIVWNLVLCEVRSDRQYQVILPQ